MERTSGVVCLLALLNGLAAAAEPLRLDGPWQGVIVLRPGEFEMDIRLNLARAADGTLTGHLSYPTQGSKQYGLGKVQLDDDTFLITSTDDNGTESVFQGRIHDGGTLLRGDLTEGGQRAPFELRRAEPRPLHPQVLRDLAADGAELKTLFNEGQGQVMLLMVLSPTCGTCRMGARLVERHLFEQVRDPRLRAYIVWEKIGPQDTREKAAEASALLTDQRIHHFWSPDRFASTAFQAPLGIQQGTAWDVFLVFGPGKRWTEAPPTPDSFMHNQKSNQELPKERLLNAKKLAGEVKRLLP